MSRKKHGRSAFRRLRLEGLERRELLAGNVTATVSGSTLVVRGDGLDNQIAIVQIDDGIYAVAGLDTEVNREPDTFITPANRFVRNIIVDLGNGDDLLAIGNDALGLDAIATSFEFDLAAAGIITADLQAEVDAAAPGVEFFLPGNLSVAMGNNDDLVALTGDIGGSVAINLGAADANTDGDGIDGNGFGINGENLTDGATIGGALSVVGGTRDDEVFINDASIGATAIALSNGNNEVIVTSTNLAVSEIQNLAITTGTGIDNIALTNLDVALNLAIATSSGTDDVVLTSVLVEYNVSINTAAGSDFVSLLGVGIGNSGVGNLAIATGDHDDGVNLEGVEVNGNVSINTGNGNDDAGEGVGIGDASVGGVVLTGVDILYSLVVALGSGNDSLDATGVNIGLNATVDAGAGDDTINATDVIVAFNAIINMNSGNNDTLTITTSSAGRAYLYGGAGNNDTLIVDAATEAASGPIFITQFENP